MSGDVQTMLSRPVLLNSCTFYRADCSCPCIRRKPACRESCSGVCGLNSTGGE